jgi:hypothetical protein
MSQAVRALTEAELDAVAAGAAVFTSVLIASTVEAAGASAAVTVVTSAPGGVPSATVAIVGLVRAATAATTTVSLAQTTLTA